jgi:hypothetical protein
MAHLLPPALRQQYLRTALTLLMEGWPPQEARRLAWLLVREEVEG